MSTPDNARFFKLLDGYSRERHGCFLAEMFLNEAGTEYILCFRPVSAKEDTQGRYASHYLRIETAEAQVAGENKVLGAGITDDLDRNLPLLRQLSS